MPLPQIEFDKVRFSYDGKSYALDGISLEIFEGEFVCILGANGSGKSTFAKHINALLIPDSGSVRVCGSETSDPSNAFYIRSNAGMVFQNPEDQIISSVVEDDVAFGPENLGVPTEELQELVEHSLKKVGLGGFEKRETHALSGGQKQRLALAGILAMEPKILILDEAESMLDPRGRYELMRACHKLNDSGYTIVCVSQFMDTAAHAGRVIVFDKGRIALDGAPTEILSQRERLIELSLDAPFAVNLSAELQNLGVPIRTAIDEASLSRETNSIVGDLPDFKAKTCEALKLQSTSCKLDEDNQSTSDVPTLLEFADVSFSYDPKTSHRSSEANAQKLALEDIDLSVNEGDFIGVAGHTGSGKTTLVQLANGLLKPTSGNVLFKGMSLSDKQARQKAFQEVGLVQQYPERQLFANTVFDDVAFGPRNLGLSAQEVERRVDEALASMHLNAADIKGKSPFELSGGQQRRVAIAGILAMNPSVLIMDEPTAALDPKSHDALLKIVEDMHEERGITVLLVSHNMDDIAKLCNRVVVLKSGRIFANDTPRAVFSNVDEMKAIGLGAPKAMELAHNVGIECVADAMSPEMLASAIASAYHALEGGGERDA